MEWIKTFDKMPPAGVKVLCKMMAGNYEEREISPGLTEWYIRNVDKWLSESSPVISDKELVLKTRIEERKLCIYVIEQDLLDHVEGDEAYTEDYITALIDEVKNHKNYIADYQSELSKQKEGSNG